MADESQALTEQHRQAQLQVRTHALRDFLLLWPLWRGDLRSFGNLVQATLPLVRVYRQASSTLAGGYYRAIRDLEQIPGPPTIRLAGAAIPEQLSKSMFVTGDIAAEAALTAGRSAAEARQTALTRVSGAVTRHVLTGGRDTILNSVQADQRAVGWARVTDGDPCYFCLTLASRGAVYKTEQTADFQAHDHCGCSAMPVFEGTSLPPDTQRWKDIYNAAQREALASGELQHGENSPAARLNAVRRHLAAHTT